MHSSEHVVSSELDGQQYRLLSSEDALTWSEAQLACEDIGGYLTTVTSSLENDLVEQLLSDGVQSGLTCTGSTATWIGLSDETEGSFAWVTGESLVYSNWAPGEPSASPDEDYVSMLCPDSGSPGRWNDAGPPAAGPTHFVCEIDPAQLAASALFEDRLFEVYSVARGVGWLGAANRCMDHGGYLATATSMAENEAIAAVLDDAVQGGLTCDGGTANWFGLFDDGSIGWTWVTGEPVTYSNWAPGEPNGFPLEDSGSLLCPDPVSGGQWNDREGRVSPGTTSSNFICEVECLFCDGFESGALDEW